MECREDGDVGEPLSSSLSSEYRHVIKAAAAPRPRSSSQDRRVCDKRRTIFDRRTACYRLGPGSGRRPRSESVTHAMTLQIHRPETDLIGVEPGGPGWEPSTVHTHYFGFQVPEAAI